MEVSQIAAVADAAGNVIEPEGTRARYVLHGFQWEEVRQPLPDGTVRLTMRNRTTGDETVEIVSADTLPAV